MPSLPSGLVNGTGLIEGPTRLPSNFSRSCCWLSPTSHIQPFKYTSAWTCALPIAAMEITAVIGVADQHDRPAHGPQELGQIRRVASKIAKRVAEPDDGEPALPKG